MTNRKFVRIPAKDLPDVFYVLNNQDNPDQGGKNVYFARYRVTSEDGKLSSRWSPKFEVPTGVSGSNIALYTGTVEGQPAEYTVSKTDGPPKTLSVTWNVDRLFRANKMFVNKFHVYVRFHSGQTSPPIPTWSFMGEVTSTNFSTIVPFGNTKADIAVLIPTYRGLDATTTLTASPASLYKESVLLLVTGFSL
jgi:hypothetical protein